MSCVICIYFGNISTLLFQEFLSQGGKWCHIDMAGPAIVDERATGYGVALLYTVVKMLSAQASHSHEKSS